MKSSPRDIPDKQHDEVVKSYWLDDADIEALRWRQEKKAQIALEQIADAGLKEKIEHAQRIHRDDKGRRHDKKFVRVYSGGPGRNGSRATLPLAISLIDDPPDRIERRYKGKGICGLLIWLVLKRRFKLQCLVDGFARLLQYLWLDDPADLFIVHMKALGYSYRQIEEQFKAIKNSKATSAKSIERRYKKIREIDYDLTPEQEMAEFDALKKTIKTTDYGGCVHDAVPDDVNLGYSIEGDDNY